MAVIQSLSGLVDVNPQWWPSASYGSVQLYDSYYYDYATLYRTQPNVRVCVDFLARNIAQLGLHVFRRVSNTDRQRLTDHPLAQVIERPLPAECKVTRYRLIESLVADLGIYFNAYWLKIRVPDAPLGLLRIPPAYITPYGGLVPAYYELNLGAQVRKLAPSEIVHFRGYNADPESSITGLSPLETLRRILAEEAAMGDYREHFWANSARINGVIERPADAPKWSETARERFKAEFEALYSGADNSGRTAILEEGMSWKEASFNAQESEYLGGRKLTREECARAYHIPLPMVGILDHATFSNIKEQHKNLYQDSLGPWLKMIEEDLELQLLPEFEDIDGVYCEFNIAEKLAGSFEEQAASFQAAVGRPWMTANEARARQNLPSLPGGDTLVTPLNVLVGGQASPRDSAPPKADPTPTPPPHRGGGIWIKAAAEGEIDATLPRVRARHEEKWAEVLAAYFKRQEAAMLSRLPSKAKAPSIADVWRDPKRWDRELAADMFRLNKATATVWAKYVAEQLDAELDEALMDPYLEETSKIGAENVNAATRAAMAEALKEDDPREALKHLFELAISVRAWEIAIGRVTGASNFGASEGARQGGMKTKTWQVNSGNPRSAHAAMDGETVEIGENFSNGMRWPGDPAGGAENNSNCQCSVRFGR